MQVKGHGNIERFSGESLCLIFLDFFLKKKIAKEKKCKKKKKKPKKTKRKLKAVPTVTGVSDAVLQHREPLLLLFLGGHTEVVMVGVRVPEDQRELGVALHKGGAPHLGFDI